MDVMSQAVFGVQGSEWGLLLRDIVGTGESDPTEPEERSRLIAESPAFNLHLIKTPTLLQYAKPRRPFNTGLTLLAGLQRNGVPAELRYYDEGHVFERPAAVADDLRRVADWFDFWIQDLPYPDASREREDARKEDGRRHETYALEALQPLTIRQDGT